MIKKILNYGIKDLHFEIRNILHKIKYNSYKDSDWFIGFDLNKNINCNSKKQFRNLCILATFIQQAFAKVDKEPPDWVKDRRLTMHKAYLNENVDEMDIFMAYQAEYDHNVFYPKGAFDVI